MNQKNQPVIPDKLFNDYFLVRHGHSEAQEKGIVCSDPEIGTTKYGLSFLGVEQIIKSTEIAMSAGYFDNLQNCVVISSDFVRARETAKLLAQTAGVPGFSMETALRERFFGELEGAVSDNYSKVWDFDKDNPHSVAYGAESPHQVQKRTGDLIHHLERIHRGKHIFLVSHGDALQILQTAFEKESPALHRTLKPLENAEIRPMKVHHH